MPRAITKIIALVVGVAVDLNINRHIINHHRHRRHRRDTIDHRNRHFTQSHRRRIVINIDTKVTVAIENHLLRHHLHQWHGVIR